MGVLSLEASECEVRYPSPDDPWLTEFSGLPEKARLLSRSSIGKLRVLWSATPSFPVLDMPSRSR